MLSIQANIKSGSPTSDIDQRCRSLPMDERWMPDVVFVPFSSVRVLIYMKPRKFSTHRTSCTRAKTVVKERTHAVKSYKSLIKSNNEN